MTSRERFELGLFEARAYFDTTHLPAEALERARAQAAKQNALVLEIFNHLRRPLSPSEVWRIGLANGMQWPLTSPRRAMTTLARDGLLEKTDAKRVGEYGAVEFLWDLPEAAFLSLKAPA